MPTFWEIVERARGLDCSAKTPSITQEALESVLSRLPGEEVVEFGREFGQILDELDTWEIWGAGYVVAGRMSENEFRGFRCWIIGKGKECFDVAIRHADDLGPYIDTSRVGNILLEDVALDVLEAGASGFSSDDILEYVEENFTRGEEFDPANVRSSYPRLSAQFLGR